MRKERGSLPPIPQSRRISLAKKGDHYARGRISGPRLRSHEGRFLERPRRAAAPRQTATQTSHLHAHTERTNATHDADFRRRENVEFLLDELHREGGDERTHTLGIDSRTSEPTNEHTPKHHCSCMEGRQWSYVCMFVRSHVQVRRRPSPPWSEAKTIPRRPERKMSRSISMFMTYPSRMIIYTGVALASSIRASRFLARSMLMEVRLLSHDDIIGISVYAGHDFDASGIFATEPKKPPGPGMDGKGRHLM